MKSSIQGYFSTNFFGPGFFLDFLELLFVINSYYYDNDFSNYKFLSMSKSTKAWISVDTILLVNIFSYYSYLTSSAEVSSSFFSTSVKPFSIMKLYKSSRFSYVRSSLFIIYKLVFHSTRIIGNIILINSIYISFDILS